MLRPEVVKSNPPEVINKVGELSLGDKLSGRYMVNAGTCKVAVDAINTAIDSFQSLFPVLREERKKHPDDLLCIQVTWGDNKLKTYTLRYKKSDISIEDAAKLMSDIGNDPECEFATYVMADPAFVGLGKILTAELAKSVYPDCNMGGNYPLKVQGAIRALFSDVDILVVLGTVESWGVSLSGISEAILTDDRIVSTAKAMDTDV